MIPEQAHEMSFLADGVPIFRWYEEEESLTVCRLPLWHDCSEELKGETFSLDGLK